MWDDGFLICKALRDLPGEVLVRCGGRFRDAKSFLDYGFLSVKADDVIEFHFEGEAKLPGIAALQPLDFLGHLSCCEAATEMFAPRIAPGGARSFVTPDAEKARE